MDINSFAVSPLDYGASVNADPETNRVAFQNAINALQAKGGGRFVVPQGIFVVNAPLTASLGQNGSIFMEGADTNSTITFTGGGQNGLVVDAGFIKLSGFRIVVSAMPNIGQGSACYLRNASALGGSFQNIVVEDMRFEGRVDARPSYFLAVNGPATSRIRGVTVVGFYNQSFPVDSTGIYIFGEVSPSGGASGDWSCEGCTVIGVGTAFLVNEGAGPGQATVEGSSFTDCVAVGVQVGLHMVGNGYQVPGHSWKGGHINAQAVCAQFDSISQFEIADCLLYLDAGGANKQGFILFNGCTQMRARDNQMIHIAQTGDTGGGVYGVAFANGTTASRAQNNDGIGFPGGSAVIYNQSGGNNRAGGNGRGGQGALLVGGNLIDLGGNHVF
ncbi:MULTISPECIES: hypothetical protein [unclassified Methylobacterium]|uniref:hypothetical protein n=1 Tax=unclassified Methylobacterium TaxID=2615210 RepID=UPI00089F0B17|nr:MULTISPECIES: hypothetical protein [unclassified Methylobacterium]SEF68958.1 hypothetical protein SAMN04488144_103304 [Methylobacterium sp. 190mf]SFT25447.1 hypothetical protein SAMN04487845_13219 [Methylobacterium sp. yr668]